MDRRWRRGRMGLGRGETVLEQQELSEPESWLLGQAATGQEADFGVAAAGERPVVRGFVLRRALLEGSGGTVSLRGAAIEGRLDLAGCSGPQGAALPGLKAEDCEFGEGIDLSFARIGRVELVGTRIGAVKARHCMIVSELILSGVRPSEGAGWIDAPSLEVGGSVWIVDTVLRSPPAREEAAIPAGFKRYALNLRDVRMGGTISIEKSALRGGIGLQNGSIKGGCWVVQCRLWAREGSALNAQGCQIDRGLFLHQSVMRGCVWLPGARIGSNLEFNNMRVRRRVGMPEEEAITAGQIAVSGHFVMKSSQFSGDVSCYSSNVAGDLDIGRTIIVGSARFGGMKIGGELLCVTSDIGFSREHLTTLKAPIPDAIIVVFDFEDAVFGRGVRLGSEEPLYRLRVFGETCFSNAQVGGDFRCQSARFENGQGRGFGIGLNTGGIRVKGSMVLRSVWIFGRFIVDNSQIEADLSLRHVYIDNGRFDALLATRALIKGSVDLLVCNICGDVTLSHSRIEGAFSWNFLDVTMVDEQAIPRLDLSWMRVGSVFTVRALNPKFDNAISIDLEGVTCRTLVDEDSGWGRQSRLNLRGLSYERSVIRHPRARDLPGQRPLGFWAALVGWVTGSFAWWYRRRPIRRAWSDYRQGTSRVAIRDRVLLWFGAVSSHCQGRIIIDADERVGAIIQAHRDWLKRQDSYRDRSGRGEEFDPQAYKAVVRALRAQGEEAATRGMMMLERWTTPQQGVLRGFGRLSFGFGFGFGLSVRRAAFALMWTLAIGFALVEVAGWSGMFVASDSGIYQLGESGTIVSVTVSCGDRIVRLLYALDEMLPVIQLHQEPQCRISVEPAWASFFWRSVLAAYVIIGKIVTTLAFLTFSGVLKRAD